MATSSSSFGPAVRIGYVKRTYPSTRKVSELEGTEFISVKKNKILEKEEFFELECEEFGMLEKDGLMDRLIQEINSLKEENIHLKVKLEGREC
jgi:hypothetical protein